MQEGEGQLAPSLAHGLVGSGHGDDDDDAGSLVQISILHPAAAARWLILYTWRNSISHSHIGLRVLFAPTLPLFFHSSQCHIMNRGWKKFTGLAG